VRGAKDLASKHIFELGTETFLAVGCTRERPLPRTSMRRFLYGKYLVRSVPRGVDKKRWNHVSELTPVL